MIIQFLAGIGILLSLYVIWVEWRLKKTRAYTALCDISKSVSCTKTIKSPYGHVFGIPNALTGLLFYTLVFRFSQYTLVILWLSVPALLFSAYLFYVSHYKMKNYCVICMGAYGVNLGIFIAALLLS